MKNRQLIFTVIKRGLFAVMIIAAYLVQLVIIPRAVQSFSIFLLPGLLCAISMCEKELPAAFFGLAAGALWDLASPVTDGAFALIFTVFCCTASLLTRYLIRNTLLTAVIFTAILSVAVFFTVQLFYISHITAELFTRSINTELVPTLISAVIFAIPFYIFISRISTRLTADKGIY